MTTTMTTMDSRRGYEALVILKSAGTEQEQARAAAQLEEPVKRLGGAVELSQALGRRRLTFRINRQTEGQYHLLRFQAPAGQVREIERLFRLNDAIIRFMILSAEEAAGAPTLSVPTHHSAGRHAGAGRGG